MHVYKYMYIYIYIHIYMYMCKYVNISCFFSRWSNQNQIASLQVELPLDDEEPEAEGCQPVVFSIIPAIIALLCFDHSYLGLSLVGVFESIEHYANCSDSSVCRYCPRMHHTVVLCCRQRRLFFWRNVQKRFAALGYSLGPIPDPLWCVCSLSGPCLLQGGLPSPCRNSRVRGHGAQICRL